MADLIDPGYLNAGKPRLTVGAANVELRARLVSEPDKIVDGMLAKRFFAAVRVGGDGKALVLEALERVSADGNLIAFAIPGMCAS